MNWIGESRLIKIGGGGWSRVIDGATDATLTAHRRRHALISGVDTRLLVPLWSLHNNKGTILWIRDGHHLPNGRRIGMRNSDRFVVDRIDLLWIGSI